MKSGTVYYKILGIVSTTCFEYLILLCEGFKYGDGAKCWGYDGTDTEPVCVEFCNFLQCHILVVT
jgi:hypothetical protein